MKAPIGPVDFSKTCANALRVCRQYRQGQRMPDYRNFSDVTGHSGRLIAEEEFLFRVRGSQYLMGLAKKRFKSFWKQSLFKGYLQYIK